MVQMAKTLWERIGAGTILTGCVLIVGIILALGRVIDNSDRQKELAAAVSALTTAKELVAADLRQKDQHLSDLSTRMARVETENNAIKLEIAKALADLAADVRNIKERLSGRVSLSVPERAG